MAGGLATDPGRGMPVPQVLGDRPIHPFGGKWNRMRGLEQPTDAPRVVQDLPSRDDVVFQDLEVKHRFSIEAEPTGNFLQGDLALAGECGVHGVIVELESNPCI